MRETFIVIFSLFTFHCIGQDHQIVDSLKGKLKQLQSEKTELRNNAIGINDSTIVNVLNKLSKNYTRLNSDTALHYANYALELALQINFEKGTADAYAVDMFKQKGSKCTLLVFAGTWCHDSQNLLPKLYRLFDKSGYPENKVTLVVVDRKKASANDLPQKWKLESVPTFIVVQNGKEIGRVVEYGKTDLLTFQR